MLIAIPLNLGTLSQSIRQTPRFALLDVNPVSGRIAGRSDREAPVYKPGVFADWLQKQGVELIIASSINDWERQRFDANGIKVVVGAPANTPERIVECFFEGKLVTAGKTLYS